MFQLKRKIKSFVFWIMIKLKIYYNESVSKKYQSFEFISVKKYFKKSNKKLFLKNNNSWITLFPDVTVKIDRPKFSYFNKYNKNFLLEKNSAYSLKDLSKRKKISGSILANLKNVKIINDTLLILIEKNLALLEVYGDLNWANFILNKWPNKHHYPISSIKFYKKPKITKRVKIYKESKSIKSIKKGIYFSTRDDNQVYHWIFDNLTRLYCLDKFPQLRHYPLIIKNNLSKFQKETLKLIGCKNKIIYQKEYDLNVENLIFPSIPSPPVLNANALVWLRNKFLKNIKQNYKSLNINFSKKIFISRNDTGHRKILNENELSQKLNKLGYQTIELSKLKIYEQMLLFHNAKKIILPHGAAGIHLLFVKKNTCITEIQSPGQLNNSLYLISKNFKANHKISIGSNPVKGYEKNYYVNIDKIVKSLE
mgnify:FL=1|tara:strand:- start:502 stop:1770 length:1269 start_codon:yes stop_codon:yes gene_type:complete